MGTGDGDNESTDVEYHWVNGVERLEMYEPGGYHPVELGEVLHDRYLIVDKLGAGGYSIIWLAMDQRKQQLVALKVGVANSRLPRHESEILRAVFNTRHPSAPSSPALPWLDGGLRECARTSIPLMLDSSRSMAPIVTGAIPPTRRKATCGQPPTVACFM